MGREVLPRVCDVEKRWGGRCAGKGLSYLAEGKLFRGLFWTDYTDKTSKDGWSMWGSAQLREQRHV